MKLTVFNKLNAAKPQPSTEPVATVGKSGRIYFNAAAIALMEAEQGNGIAIVQEEETGNWYFMIDDTNGFALKFETEKRAFFASRYMTRVISESFGEALPLRFQLDTVEHKKQTYFILEPLWESEEEAEEAEQNEEEDQA